MPNLDDVKRDPDVWFPDGSVVLYADNTLFKVYTGILCKHSVVFKDLFEFPQPQSDEAETYDGCPLIPLYGDTALDVHDFLLVIHDMQHFRCFTYDVQVAIALLRITTKYQVHVLRKQVIEALATRFPTTLAEYDAWLEGVRNSKVQQLTMAELIALLTVAETAAPAFCPAAMLFMSMYYRRDLGVIMQPVEFRGTTMCASPAIVRNFLNGSTRLSEQSRQEVYPAIFAPSDASCLSHELCNASRLLIISRRERSDGHLDPLVTYPQIFSEFCEPCKATLQRQMNDGRHYVWQQLPRTFGFAEWPELLRATFDS